MRRGERRQQRGLAGVGQPDQPDVRDQPQLEPDRPLLARLPLLRVLGRLMRRGREVHVPQAAATTPADHDLLTSGDEVREQGAQFAVEDRRAGRHREVQVLPGLAVALRALTPPTGRGAEMVLVAKVAQRRLADVDAQVYGATAPAVPAVGATAGNVGLTPEGGRSVAARPGAHDDADLIEEHRAHCRTTMRLARIRASVAPGGRGRRSRSSGAG